MSGRQRQHGAAILTAMLLVALVATLSAAALWQQWRALEVEKAERTRIQSSWMLQGATDWARLLLREDARAGVTDHLGEPWAVTLQEASLRAFLAGNGNNIPDDDNLQDAFLSGQITDLQSRLNVTNLVQDGRPHGPSLQAFSRLFETLQLPQSELLQLLAQLQLALEPVGIAAPNAQAGQATHPLLPRSVEQLPWLGLSARSVAALRSYVTVLPERTALNLNTAPAVVLQAAIPTLDMAGAQRLVAARAQNHFRTLTDVVQASGIASLPLNDTQHSVNSRYFDIRARLRLGGVRTQEHTVVQREGLLVKALWKEREPVADGFVQ
jgi:general secretion pathway protein K